MVETLEAQRCLQCKIPKCVEGCPINNRIPEFIEQIKNENYEKAYEIICSVNPFGAICGRVCPYETQCQGHCVRGIKSEPIQIGKLETFVCDWARENKIKINYDIKENGMKVAIIGAGPAGLACAVELRKLGYDVTIFEKENFLGGILMYGIPEYRLPKKVVKDVIDDLLKIGIKEKLNTIFMREDSNVILNKQKSTDTVIAEKSIVTIKSLFEEGYKAIFIAIGAEISNLLPLKEIRSNTIIGANEFLRKRRDCNGKQVIVIGGGNVAIDSARVAKRNDADVTIIYRKQKENMPANKVEIEEAEKEGVKFIFGTNVIKINENNQECKNSFIAECDTGKMIVADIIVMAIGSKPNLDYLDKDFKFTEQNLLMVNESYETSIENVFAGGDLVQKKATVCMAIKNGKDAAKAIDNKIKKHKEIT